jgi:GDP-4-dehydro-6-deoxy-D-mannose reductase
MTTTVPFKKALLTGGAGFVGTYLSAAFRRRFPDADLVLLCRPGEELCGSFNVVKVDLTDEKAVGEMVDQLRPDLVMHLAAQASVDHAMGSSEQTWRVNFCGTMWLGMAVARINPTAKFLFVSSAEVYGTSFNSGPVNETTPLRPINPYARSKAFAEEVLDHVLPSSSKLIIARPFNHTGPGQDERFALPAFAAQIARIEKGKQEPRLSVGNLSAERDFMDVEDVVDAYLRLIATPGLPNRSTFNISSGSAYPISGMLDRLRKLARVSFEILPNPEKMRPLEIARTVGDATKLREATGWAPSRSLDEILARLLDYWRERVDRDSLVRGEIRT